MLNIKAGTFESNFIKIYAQQQQRYTLVKIFSDNSLHQCQRTYSNFDDNAVTEGFSSVFSVHEN